MSKLIKNWTYLFASDVFQAVISFFVFMFLARKLNPEGYGTLNALLALASIFSVFATNISANLVLTREFTLHPKTSLAIFKIVFPIRIFSVLLAIIAVITYQLYKGESQTGYIYAISLIVFSTVIWDLAESIAFGHFVTKLSTVISISASFIWLIIVILLPNEDLNVNLVIWAYAGLFLLRGVVYLLLSYSKFVKANKEKTTLKIQTVLVMSMPFLWMRAVGVFGEQVPILLLKGYSGATEVGYYAVGNKFVMPITLAVTTGLRAVFPFMTKLFNEDKEKFKQKLISAFILVFIIGASIAALLTVSSAIWLPLLFGESYYQAINAFNYQAWFGVLLSFDLLLSTVLSSTYRQRTLAIITTIDVILIFPLMYFASGNGAEGMAIAKLIGTLVAVGYHIIVVIWILKIKLNNLPFLMAGLYFLILMISSIFLHSIIVKISIICLTLISLSLINNSPLKAIALIGYNEFKKQFNN